MKSLVRGFFLPFFPDLLIIDLLADLPVDHPEDEQFDQCDHSIDDDGILAGFSCRDIGNALFRRMEETVADGQKEIIDTMDDAASPDVPGLPVKKQDRQTEDTGLNRLADCLQYRPDVRQIGADDMCCSKRQRRRDST